MAEKSPTPMRDRFRGGSTLDTSTISMKRSWDTGTSGDQGAPYRQDQGNAKTIKSDAKYNNSNSGMKPMGGLGNSMAGPVVGKSVTAGPRGMGVDGGHGPKVKGGRTPPPIQKGRTTGPDKTPKGSKTGAGRFQGGLKGREEN